MTSPDWHLTTRACSFASVAGCLPAGQAAAKMHAALRVGACKHLQHTLQQQAVYTRRISRTLQQPRGACSCPYRHSFPARSQPRPARSSVKKATHRRLRCSCTMHASSRAACSCWQRVCSPAHTRHCRKVLRLSAAASQQSACACARCCPNMICFDAGATAAGRGVCHADLSSLALQLHAALPEASAPLPGAGSRMDPVAEHGNYRRYYHYRVPDAFAEDPRMKVCPNLSLAAWHGGASNPAYFLLPGVLPYHASLQ